MCEHADGPVGPSIALATDPMEPCESRPSDEPIPVVADALKEVCQWVDDLVPAEWTPPGHPVSDQHERRTAITLPGERIEKASSTYIDTASKAISEHHLTCLCPVEPCEPP